MMIMVLPYPTLPYRPGRERGREREIVSVGKCKGWMGCWMARGWGGWGVGDWVSNDAVFCCVVLVVVLVAVVQISGCLRLKGGRN